jgi:hypothetical protein
VTGDGLENGVQSGESEVFVGGNGNSLVRGNFGFKDNVASDLMYDPIVPISTEELDQILSAQVAGILIRWPGFRHGRDAGESPKALATSLRSKKKAETASLTFFLRASQSLASVNMGSVKHSATNPPSAS